MSQTTSQQCFFGSTSDMAINLAKRELGHDLVIVQVTPPGKAASELGAPPGEYAVMVGLPGDALPPQPAAGNHWVSKQYGRAAAPAKAPAGVPASPGLNDKQQRIARGLMPAAPMSAPASASARRAGGGASPGAPDWADGARALQAQMVALREDMERRRLDDEAKWRRLERNLCELPGILAPGTGAPASGAGLAWYDRLRERGLVETLARGLAALAENMDESAGVPALLARLAGMRAERLAMAAPAARRRDDGRACIVVFAGPPGAGKTLALAKFALAAQQDGARDVAIINADGVRPGAEAQLHTLGNIAGFRVADAKNLERAAELCQIHRDVELLLVDTPGYSPRSEGEMARLRQFVEGARPDETHLVLPADYALEHARRVVGAFGRAGADRVLLSKADLTDAPALPVNLQYLLEREADGVAPPPAWSWIGTGASYRAGLLPASPELLANLTFGLTGLHPDSGGLNDANL